MLTTVSSQLYQFCKKLIIHNRSLTGEGTKKTLYEIKKNLTKLKITSVPTGFKAFDWEVPKEWNIKDAYILGPNGKKILDLKNNFLHVVGYSHSINAKISLGNLKKKIFSNPKKPNSIPYVTSYYKKDWGFCMTHNQKVKLKEGTYQVFIDSELKNGVMNYGEIFIPGRSKKEIFLSTYICHPQMANNEMSGIAVTTFILKYFKNLPKQKYSIRAVFVPETIGSIVYLKKNLKQLKEKVIAGFNITCVGDERTYSYLPSRNGNTISDIAAKHVLKWSKLKFIKYSWNERGSDERQYCSPGVDLPIASIMRSKYGEYPEYHTSDDNFEKVVTKNGLFESYLLIIKAIEAIQNNCFPKSLIKCEPFLSKYNLYNPVNLKYSHAHKFTSSSTDPLYNLISHSDGKTSLIDIAEKILVPVWDLYDTINLLKKKNIIKIYYAKQ